MNKIHVTGASLIAGGAALVGAMSGWELGPCRLVISQDLLALMGAGLCGSLALAACSLAVDRSEAHSKRRGTMQRLSRILFDTTDAPESSLKLSPQPTTDSASTTRSKRTDSGSNLFTRCGACP